MLIKSAKLPICCAIGLGFIPISAVDLVRVISNSLKSLVKRMRMQALKLVKKLEYGT